MVEAIIIITAIVVGGILLGWFIHNCFSSRNQQITLAAQQKALDALNEQLKFMQTNLCHKIELIHEQYDKACDEDAKKLNHDIQIKIEAIQAASIKYKMECGQINEDIAELETEIIFRKEQLKKNNAIHLDELNEISDLEKSKIAISEKLNSLRTEFEEKNMQLTDSIIDYQKERKGCEELTKLERTHIGEIQKFTEKVLETTALLYDKVINLNAKLSDSHLHAQERSFRYFLDIIKNTASKLFFWKKSTPPTVRSNETINRELIDKTQKEINRGLEVKERGVPHRRFTVSA